jgi:hypothetical protein
LVCGVGSGDRVGGICDYVNDILLISIIIRDSFRSERWMFNNLETSSNPKTQVRNSTANLGHPSS